jgi:hypothetical protein
VYTILQLGLAQPMVESLTGYIARLAEAHCVSTGVLHWKEIETLVGKGNIFRFRVTGDGGYSTHTINGHGSPAVGISAIRRCSPGLARFQSARLRALMARRAIESNHQSFEWVLPPLAISPFAAHARPRAL